MRAVIGRVFFGLFMLLLTADARAGDEDLQGSAREWEKVLLRKEWSNADIRGPFVLTLDFFGTPNLAGQSREFILDVLTPEPFGIRGQYSYKCTYSLSVREKYLQLKCRAVSEYWGKIVPGQKGKSTRFDPFTPTDFSLYLFPQGGNSPDSCKDMKAMYLTDVEDFSFGPGKWRPGRGAVQELFGLPRRRAN